MIIDTFTFFNDFDMLDCRLEYLYPHVDYFVICECNLSYSGKPKPMYFKQNMHRYAKYLDKIRYAPYYLDPDIHYDPWFIEMNQRNQISMRLFEFPHLATVLISDCDEIVNIDYLPAIAHELREGQKTIVHMGYQLLQYNLENRYPNLWWHPAAGKLRDVVRYGINPFRTYLSDILVNERAHIGNSGWHLSFFLSPEKIAEKFAHTSHQEYNNQEYNDIEKIKNRINNKRIVCTQFGDEPLLPVNRAEYPEHFIKVFEKRYPGN